LTAISGGDEFQKRLHRGTSGGYRRDKFPRKGFEPTYAVVDFGTVVQVSPRNAFSIITANPCLLSIFKVIIIEPEGLAIVTSPT
jgi:hypothetical protein